MPDEDFILRFAKDNNIASESFETMLSDESVLAIFAKVFKTYSRQAAAHEKIRAFRLLLEPFTIENGLLTPTLKVKRKSVETAHAALIESMYDGVI